MNHNIMNINIIGIIKGIDNYNKLVIIVLNPDILTRNVNDIINPYRYTNLGMECNIIIPKYKDYYITLINNNIDKNVDIVVKSKKYCFNNKKGTSLLLKEMNIK